MIFAPFCSVKGNDMITFRVVSPVNAAIHVRSTPCKSVDVLGSMRSLGLLLHNGSCAFLCQNIVVPPDRRRRHFGDQIYTADADDALTGRMPMTPRRRVNTKFFPLPFPRDDTGIHLLLQTHILHKRKELE